MLTAPCIPAMPAWCWGEWAETVPDHQSTALHPPRSLALKPQLAVLRQQIILLCYTSETTCCVTPANHLAVLHDQIILLCYTGKSSCCVTRAKQLAVLTQHLLGSAMTGRQTGWWNIVNERALWFNVFHRANCICIWANGFCFTFWFTGFCRCQLCRSFSDFSAIHFGQCICRTLDCLHLRGKISLPNWVSDLGQSIQCLTYCAHPTHAPTPIVSRLVP